MSVSCLMTSRGSYITLPMLQCGPQQHTQGTLRMGVSCVISVLETILRGRSFGGPALPSALLALLG